MTTTRYVVVGVCLLASVGCEQIDPVSGPDPTPPSVSPVVPPDVPKTGELRMLELPPAMRWDVRGGGLETSADPHGVAAASTMAPMIDDYFVAVSWGGTATLEGWAFMTFFANWAQQELELTVYKSGSLLTTRRWAETGSSVLPRSAAAITAGAVNVGVQCGAVGNGQSSHSAEMRLYTTQGWTAVARSNVSDASVAEQAECSPPPICDVRPQTAVSANARVTARAAEAILATNIDQCAPTSPPGGGEQDGESGGEVCYEVWLVYPDTGYELYLGDVCYGQYAT